MNDATIQLFNTVPDLYIDWLATFIKTLITGIGVVGVGVIVFTLILKTIVLPFDIFQRVNQRKQSLKMEQMRPELEKLQKQYANDKQMYSAKMMELYKKNNYSMLAPCIPMILSMVILIVAFNELNGFSQYSNLQTYKEMVNSYNEAILAYYPDLDSFTDTVKIGDQSYHRYISTDENDGKFIYYIVAVDANGNETGTREYYIDVDKCYEANKTEADEYISDGYTKEDAVLLVVKSEAREAAAETFRSFHEGFLWIKNIWYSDTTFNTTVAKDYSTFTSKITKTDFVDENGNKYTDQIKNVIPEGEYEEITYNLTEEKSEYNGYFVLVALSIGMMFLSQFIAMKSQKAQNDLGTVDGQGKNTQKIMMIIMPVIFGVFAFTYSAAFSIYMIISSAYSILTMVITNAVVTVVYNKKEEKMERERYRRVAPVIYNKEKNNKTKK